jgi:DNA-binding transcriptional LysR family regulator
MTGPPVSRKRGRRGVQERSRIPLAPLQTFHLVCRHQSFSQAARQLGVSQPAVTQQIRRLERSIGLTLFDRIGRRVVATDAGRTLDTYAQRIFHMLDAARDAIDSLAGVQTGHLMIGASRTAGAYYAAGLLDRFKHRYPGVQVSLTVGNSETILERVLDFSLHAALIAGPSDNPHVTSVPLIRDRLLVIVAPGHRLDRKTAVGIEELHAYPLILREPGSGTRRVIERALRAKGLDVVPSMELESNEAIKSAVADGVGIGFMAQAAAAGDVGAGRLVARPLREPLYLDFSLIYHRDRTLSPVVGAFLALLPPGGAQGGGAR